MGECDHDDRLKSHVIAFDLMCIIPHPGGVSERPSRQFTITINLPCSYSGYR